MLYRTNVYILVFSNITDILKGFLTAYYYKGEIVTDKKQMAINYLKTQF